MDKRGMETKMMIEKMDGRFRQYWEGLHFQLPTPIQESVYQPLLQGEDVIGLSPTGTGKTLAYALPLLEKTQPSQELQLIVLAPSQELAVQVGRVLEEWGNLKELRVQTIIGGANLRRQIEKLKEKPEVVVGTPGRLLELADQKKLKLHQVQTAVLDEADYLLQPEHLDTLRELIRKLPGQRQLAFFSATASSELEQVGRWFNTNPENFDASAEGNLHDQTEHGYLLVDNRRRADALRRLGNVEGMQALVFVNSTQELDFLAEKMQFEGIPVRMLHSEYGKGQRQHALEEFRKGEAVFLLTTDLSARGIDIPDLPYVIHYDLPLTAEIYLHRSGRTGRMGKKGRVLSLVTDRNRREVRKFIPDPDAFKQWYLHSGRLVDELPERNEEEEARRKQPTAKMKGNHLEERTTRKRKSPTAPDEKTKTKKKNRAKKQKNKGARRKKGTSE